MTTKEDQYWEEDIEYDLEHFYDMLFEADRDFERDKTLLSGESGTRYGYSIFTGTSGHILELESEFTIMEVYYGRVDYDFFGIEGSPLSDEDEEFLPFENNFAYALRDYINPDLAEDQWLNLSEVYGIQMKVVDNLVSEMPSFY